MDILRLRNDCVAQFFAYSINKMSGGSISRIEAIERIADAMSDSWRIAGEIPAVKTNEALELFSVIVKATGIPLGLNIVRFREIPLGLYEDYAGELLSKGAVVGVGYRARYIFGGEGVDLHVSGLMGLDSKGYQLVDVDLGSDNFVKADLLEQAVVSADSGFWIVNRI